MASDRKDLEAAIERHDGDDHMTEDRFDEAFEGLPEDALVRTFFDVEQLLETDPDTEDARKVEYVSAMRDFGLTASFADDAIDVDFRLSTEGESLEDADLPFATGEESPPVIEADGEIGFGLRDPAQIFRFGETAGQAIDPAGFGQYETGKRAIERQLDVSIEDDVLAQLDRRRLGHHLDRRQVRHAQRAHRRAGVRAHARQDRPRAAQPQRRVTRTR